MKWIISTAIAVALLLLSFVVSTSTLTTTGRAYASKMDGKPFGAESPKNLCFPNGCKGAGGGPNKTCSAYAQVCASRNGNSPQCQSARENCMHTGTFRGPRGGVFSGLARE